MYGKNKENPTVKKNQLVNDLLMKPFSLGWTREVVKRLITNNRTPNCDIYYLNPNKKRLRSLIEVKYHCSDSKQMEDQEEKKNFQKRQEEEEEEEKLNKIYPVSNAHQCRPNSELVTDGLSPECFSFKKEPLGLSPDLEIIRNAKAREKGGEKKKTSSSGLKKQVKPKTEEEEVNDSEKEANTQKTEEEDLKPNDKVEINETEEKSDANNINENIEVKKDSEDEPETKSRRAKPNVKQSDENKTFISKKKTKTKPKTVEPTKSIRLQSVRRRKTVLNTIRSAKQAKQAKLVDSRKVLKKIVSKRVGTPKHKLSKSKIDKKATLKTKKSSAMKLKTAKKPMKTSIKKAKNEIAKEPETNETDKKSATRDLKSIVKKNIVKYREMREKQKLGVVKAQRRSPSRKIPIAAVSRPRIKPIAKDKSFYLKPLEKGWRRELVYRTNCAKAGQQADVYYFHPSGKKLRSFREISENLTHGLTIECFTFSKEPIGCGEPSEVIRNARSNQKN